MEEDKLKKLIQNIGLEEPGEGFTDHIMKMVEGEAALSPNSALLPVIQSELLAGPGFQFTSKVMGSLQPKNTRVAAGVFTKKIKLVISGLVGTVLLLVLVFSHAGLHIVQNDVYFTGFRLNLTGPTMSIIRVAGPILPYLIPLSVLLFLDYLFRIKQEQLKSRGQSS